MTGSLALSNGAVRLQRLAYARIRQSKQQTWGNDLRKSSLSHLFEVDPVLSRAATFRTPTPTCCSASSTTSGTISSTQRCCVLRCGTPRWVSKTLSRMSAKVPLNTTWLASCCNFARRGCAFFGQCSSVMSMLRCLARVPVCALLMLARACSRSLLNVQCISWSMMLIDPISFIVCKK